MSFFLHFRRMRARKEAILLLDEEISQLQNKKTSLGIEIAEKSAQIKALQKEINVANEFLTLKDQIEAAHSKLDSLNEEIVSQSNSLSNLRKQHSLSEDCISLEELKSRLTTELVDSIDDTIKKLFEAYPNVYASELNISNEIYFKYNIDKQSILATIDRNLTSFALNHQIDPLYYKELMYKFNAKWFEKFDAMPNRVEKDDTSHTIILRGFIVLYERTE